MQGRSGIMERARRLFNVLIVMAGALVALESIILLFSGYSLTSIEFGTIRSGTLFLLALQVVMFCAIVIATSALTFARKLQVAEETRRTILNILFIIGAILAVEGVAAINISFTLMSSVATTSAMLAGLQLFCLGMLVMFGNMLSGQTLELTSPSPRHIALIFILLLFPSAFLIV